MHFSDILIKKNIIDRKQLSEIVAKSKETGVAMEKLLEANNVSSEDILKAKAEASGMEARSVIKEQIPFDILKQIPEEAVRHYQFIPLGVRDGILEVGMVNPDNTEAREALQFIISKLNVPFNLFLITEKDFDSVLAGYQGLTGEVSRALGELETAITETTKEETTEFAGGETTIVEETPVTKIVAVILKHAIAGHASDIHIEAFENKVRVRFRVDGVLYTSLLLPFKVHDAIVSRIKILTDMKLDEKRKPQDGRFGARIEGREIDFRVSTFPSFLGEKIVIRILDKEKNIKTLDQLGLAPRQFEIIKNALNKPYGLILLTGPTGSGKTTTLYAMMDTLDKEKNNIVSLEDPVEYNMVGISQSQVNPEIGYDFANGLRSILRQDPDMIMVGEIRDRETAALAIQAALTGHLVFSTLHTNNAAGVIPRLIDMGVDPFLIAPTFLLAISQRLVRLLCPDSRKEIEVDDVIKKRLEKDLMDVPPAMRSQFAIPEKLYQGVVSESCPQGSKGRMGVYEILQKTPELEKTILSNPTDIEIMKVARAQNMLTLREEGILKILQGQVGIEDLNEL